MQDLSNKNIQELTIIAESYYALNQKISKLYLKLKTENAFLLRKNIILQDRLNYLKVRWEQKNSCKLTFEGIDAIIKKEKKNIKYNKGEIENGNAEIERLQS